MPEFINPYEAAFKDINIVDLIKKYCPFIKEKRSDFGAITNIVNEETLDQFFTENQNTPLEEKIQILASRLFKSVSQIGHEREKLFACLNYTEDTKQYNTKDINVLAEKLLKDDNITLDHKKSFMLDSLRQYIMVSTPQEVFDRLSVLEIYIPNLYENINPYVSQKLIEYMMNRFHSTLGKNNDLLTTIENKIQDKTLQEAMAIMENYLKQI